MSDNSTVDTLLELNSAGEIVYMSPKLIASLKKIMGQDDPTQHITLDVEKLIGFKQRVFGGGPIPEVDPFHDCEFKPGMWVECIYYGVGRLVESYTVDGIPGIKHEKDTGSGWENPRQKVVKWRILTPSEVEAHERKLKYPVLAPGDVVNTRTWIAEVFKPRGIPCNGKVVVSAESYTQEECAAKLASGEWVKYVREVQG